MTIPRYELLKPLATPENGERIFSTNTPQDLVPSMPADSLTIQKYPMLDPDTDNTHNTNDDYLRGLT